MVCEESVEEISIARSQQSVEVEERGERLEDIIGKAVGDRISLDDVKM
jgi:hypothetical protein